MPNFEYTEGQKIALSYLRSRSNVFLTGPAGTGKSAIFSEFLKEEKLKRKIPVLASTGAAAVLIGGRTFHSFFGLGTMMKDRHIIVADALDNPNIRRNISTVSTFAIDEISMIPAEALSIAEEITRKIRERHEVWGGVQLLTSGDFLQLPPVSTEKTPAEWAFRGDVWERSQFKICYLTEVVRTHDMSFVSILHRIRRGVYDQEIYDFLKERMISEDALDVYEGTRLYPHRRSVDEVNYRKLEELPGEEKSFETWFTGDDRYYDSLKRSMPIPEVLRIKVGALVMIRRNAQDLSYVNGTLGVIKEIHPDYLLIESTRLNGSKYLIPLDRTSYDWVNGSGRTIASAKNFPITLAWACTIHKAQGATIDNVCVDLRGVWEHGQAYVALSRVRHVDGLKIMGWDNSSIRVDPSVVGYYDGICPESCMAPENEIEGVFAETPRVENIEKDPRHDGYEIVDLLRDSSFDT